MAAIHLLTDKRVQDAGSGDHADGGGLSLRIDGSNAKWLYRATASKGLRCRTSPSTIGEQGLKRRFFFGSVVGLFSETLVG